MTNKYLLQLDKVIDIIKSMIRNSKGQFTKDSVVRKYDFTGKIFTYLTCIAPIRTNNNSAGWLCKCRCGKETKVATYELTSGHTKSCGCYSHKLAGDRMRTHGKSLTKLHSIWKGIRERCYTKTCSSYKNYGGRGITMSDDWHNYINFERDMGQSYKIGLSIERIDNNGNYCKENCKWATKDEQAKNQRNNHKITCNGVTKILADWVRETGINSTTILTRINRLGWDIESALTIKPPYSNKIFKRE